MTKAIERKNTDLSGLSETEKKLYRRQQKADSKNRVRVSKGLPPHKRQQQLFPRTAPTASLKPWQKQRLEKRIVKQMPRPDPDEFGKVFRNLIAQKIRDGHEPTAQEMEMLLALEQKEIETILAVKQIDQNSRAVAGCTWRSSDATARGWCGT